MKKTILTFCTIALLLFACNNEKKEDEKIEGGDTAPKKEQAWIPIDSIMMDKYWKENMTISDQHKMLAKSAGTWTGDMTMWMADGDPPQKMPTTTETKTIYGGLYVQSTHTGNMMGMPFEGMSIMGYDNMKKEFFSTWIDNMGSGFMVSTGTWDDASKKLTLTTTTKCMNGQDGTIREVFTMVDDNNQMLEMYGPDSKTGKEFKTMEIKYTRKK